MLSMMTRDGGVVRADSGELSYLVTPCRKGLTARCDIEKTYKNQCVATVVSHRRGKQDGLALMWAGARMYAHAREGGCFLAVFVCRSDIVNQIKDLSTSYLQFYGLTSV